MSLERVWEKKLQVKKKKKGEPGLVFVVVIVIVVVIKAEIWELDA